MTGLYTDGDLIEYCQYQKPDGCYPGRNYNFVYARSILGDMVQR